jgi:hypothetical protein
MGARWMLRSAAAKLAAGYIVNTNADIAPDTVSGSQPPSGAHNNILANSIGGADILESSLAKVPSATVADRSTRTGVALNWQTTTDGDSRTLARVDGLTIKGTCYNDTEFTSGRLWLYANSTNATNLLGVTRSNDTFYGTHTTYTLTTTDTAIATDDDTDADLVLVYRERKPNGVWVIVALPLHLRITGSSCSAFGVASSITGPAVP